MYKDVKYNLLHRFCPNILFKTLILFLIVIVVISFGRLALFGHTFNRCDLVFNFVITQLTKFIPLKSFKCDTNVDYNSLTKVIQFNSIQPLLVLIFLLGSC